MHGHRFKVSPLLLAAMILFAAACQPTTPADTSASNLDVKIEVLDRPPRPGQTNLVLMQFLRNGRPVEFAAGETVVCNGVSLAYNGLASAYGANVPAGSVAAYTFVYARSGADTTVAVPVRPRPVITSPTDGSTVVRRTNLPITYVPGNGIDVDVDASDGTHSVGQNSQPDTGTYPGLDVTPLRSGPGTISITRRFEGTPSGTGFHSVHWSYRTVGHINIVWQ